MSYRPGPGLVVAAAFVGPGTAATATLAGASFGPTLLWAVLLSIVVTLVLQEASARLAVTSGLTLGQALSRLAPGRTLQRALVLLVLAAVVLGAAAFQAGNLLGTSLATGALTGAWPGWTVLAAADLAFLLLWFGRPQLLERVLGGLVALMAAAFLANLALLPIDWRAVARGLLPSMPEGSLLLALALVGTTVVPYNLFLHGGLLRAAGWTREDLPRARLDLAVSIGIGGLLTAALLIASAAATVGGVAPETAREMARGLEPLLGDAAVVLFSLGLFAAGFTSAVTAPLAAAYAAAHVLGRDDALRGPAMRAVWIPVLLVGAGFALTGVKPVAAIVVAQAANGILLSVVAVALLVAVNRMDLVGEDRNGWWGNALGILALVVTGVLGSMLIYELLGGA